MAGDHYHHPNSYHHDHDNHDHDNHDDDDERVDVSRPVAGRGNVGWRPCREEDN